MKFQSRQFWILSWNSEDGLKDRILDTKILINFCPPHCKQSFLQKCQFHCLMQVLDSAGVLFPRWYPPFPPITDPPSHLPPGQPQFPHNQSALPLLCFPPLCFIFIFFRFLCSWFASFLFPASPRWVDNRVTNTRQLEQLDVPKTNEMLGGGLLCLTVKIFRKLNWARVFCLLRRLHQAWAGRGCEKELEPYC